jgi:hypothetical protein
VLRTTLTTAFCMQNKTVRKLSLTRGAVDVVTTGIRYFHDHIFVLSRFITVIAHEICRLLSNTNH